MPSRTKVVYKFCFTFRPKDVLLQPTRFNLTLSFFLYNSENKRTQSELSYWHKKNIFARRHFWQLPQLSMAARC